MTGLTSHKHPSQPNQAKFPSHTTLLHQSLANPPQQPSGPPYLPTVPQLGGVPTVDLDVPISAVLLALFVAGAATHMTILQINLRRKHKFLFSGVLFGFCMARISALTLRIAWATHLTNANVAIAAGVMTVAGVILLFIVNLIFAQRILRACWPELGWHPIVRGVWKGMYALVAACLIMAVVASVMVFFTLDPTVRSQCRSVQLVATTVMMVLAFLPTPVVLVAGLHARQSGNINSGGIRSSSSSSGSTAGGGGIDHFGTGQLRTKIALVLFTSLLLTLGAGFRTGVAYDLRLTPAWFHHKACFYIFNFVIELVVVYLYAAVRFDRRFHVPDGSSKLGHYRGEQEKGERGLEGMVNDESEMFGPTEGQVKRGEVV